VFLSPPTKKPCHLHQLHLHGLPPNYVPTHHAPLFPALPPLLRQPATPRIQNVFLGRGLKLVASWGCLSYDLCRLSFRLSCMTFLSVLLEWL